MLCAPCSPPFLFLYKLSQYCVCLQICKLFLTTFPKNTHLGLLIYILRTSTIDTQPRGTLKTLSRSDSIATRCIYPLRLRYPSARLQDTFLKPATTKWVQIQQLMQSLYLLL